MSKNSPLISVVMPVFNCESTILQALNSALCQTYRNIEVWVHDDGSTDKTTEVVAQRAIEDGRIHLVSGNSHSGLPSVARNAAASHANGKYLAFLDGDDIWTKAKLARQVSILENHSDVALVHSALLEFIQRRVTIDGLLHLSPPEIRRAGCAGGPCLRARESEQGGASQERGAQTAPELYMFGRERPAAAADNTASIYCRLEQDPSEKGRAGH